MMLDLETEVEMKLPGRFKVSPQIAGAIKAVPGVVDVQTAAEADPAQVIEEFGVPGRLPVAAIRAAQANRETMVPAFLRTLDDFLELKASANPNALFFIFHLFGEWREKSAYWPLAVFLRLPPDVLNTILGDCITETSHRVMAAVFDGDPEPLYQIIRDPDADEYVRAKMLQTLAMLTRQGKLPRDATAAFLRDCFPNLSQKRIVTSGAVGPTRWLGSD